MGHPTHARSGGLWLHAARLLEVGERSGCFCRHLATTWRADAAGRNLVNDRHGTGWGLRLVAGGFCVLGEHTDGSGFDRRDGHRASEVWIQLSAVNRRLRFRRTVRSSRLRTGSAVPGGSRCAGASGGWSTFYRRGAATKDTTVTVTALGSLVSLVPQRDHRINPGGTAGRKVPCQYGGSQQDGHGPFHS